MKKLWHYFWSWYHTYKANLAIAQINFHENKGMGATNATTAAHHSAYTAYYACRKAYHQRLSETHWQNLNPGLVKQ